VEDAEGGRMGGNRGEVIERGGRDKGEEEGGLRTEECPPSLRLGRLEKVKGGVEMGKKKGSRRIRTRGDKSD